MIHFCKGKAKIWNYKGFSSFFLRFVRFFMSVGLSETILQAEYPSFWLGGIVESGNSISVKKTTERRFLTHKC